MHLMGHPLPALTALPSTAGGEVDLFMMSLNRPVLVFAYPRTGRPGVPNPLGWDAIPGARGCTPHLCSVRESVDELQRREADLAIFGLSTQTTEYQKEAADRLHLPFPLLSDAKLEFTHKLELPTMQVEGETLLKRITLLLRGGQVTRVDYPVFPPDKAAERALPMLEPDGPSAAQEATAQA